MMISSDPSDGSYIKHKPQFMEFRYEEAKALYKGFDSEQESRAPMLMKLVSDRSKKNP